MEFYDKSYLHTYLASYLMNASGQVCFKAEHVRLYLNGSFLGLYVMVENMDEQLLADRGLDINGNLYETRNRGASLGIHDNLYYHWEIKNDNSIVWDDLQNLISQINNVPDGQYLKLG